MNMGFEIDQTELDKRFDFHPADTPERQLQHSEARTVVKDAVAILIDLVPPGREQSTMVTKLEEALFWANAGIARNPVVSSTGQ